MKFPSVSLVTALMLSLPGLALADRTAADQITAADPYVRLLPPQQPNTAAFVALKNADAKDHKLVKAESSVARTVELHEHVHEGGVMKMRPVKDITLKAHDTTTLQPGGYHIMLLGLKQALRADQKVPLTLTFEDGTTLKLEAPVRKP